jgi:hypothetical protein
MIVCFRCTAETRDDLNRLMATGTYRDIGEAITAAVRNQVLMEQEVAEKGAIIIGSAAPPFPLPPRDDRAELPQPQVQPVKNGNLKKDRSAPKTSPAVERPDPPSASAAPTVPVLFQLEGFPQEPPTGLADLPADMWATGQVIPLDRWVLGQFNRLLPAKANSRALVRLFLDQEKGLPIEPTAERIAADAAVLGDYLTALDEARKTSRDDALATAFPTTAEGGDKGRSRYANQFVVYQNGRGELSGLMVDLKLINVMHQRKERLIVPTKIAWQFARLPNPVLDEPTDGPTEKFSPEERALLLRHIVTSVPVEAFAYRVILEAVSHGSNSPDTIDAALKAYVSEDRADKLSPSFLASQRSGAISRMSDLGLVERRRDGVRVFYEITDEGRTFLAHYAAAAR